MIYQRNSHDLISKWLYPLYLDGSSEGNFIVMSIKLKSSPSHSAPHTYTQTHVAFISSKRHCERQGRIYNEITVYIPLTVTPSAKVYDNWNWNKRIINSLFVRTNNNDFYKSELVLMIWRHFESFYILLLFISKKYYIK